MGDSSRIWGHLGESPCYRGGMGWETLRESGGILGNHLAIEEARAVEFLDETERERLRAEYGLRIVPVEAQREHVPAVGDWGDRLEIGRWSSEIGEITYLRSSRGHQKSSVVISGHQREHVSAVGRSQERPDAIRSQQRPSGAIEATGSDRIEGPSRVIEGHHQGSSMADGREHKRGSYAHVCCSCEKLVERSPRLGGEAPGAPSWASPPPPPSPPSPKAELHISLSASSVG